MKLAFNDILLTKQNVIPCPKQKLYFTIEERTSPQLYVKSLLILNLPQ